jgi:KEOPS complex subunit Pcc1
MRRTAIIRIELPSQKLADVLLAALTPETQKPATSRSKVSLEGGERILTMKVEAEDTSALRSTLNSYLRWVALVRDTYEAAVNIEKTATGRKNP